MNIVDRMLGVNNSTSLVENHYYRSQKGDKMNKRNLSIIIGGVIALSVAGGLVGCGVEQQGIKEVVSIQEEQKTHAEDKQPAKHEEVKKPVKQDPVKEVKQSAKHEEVKKPSKHEEVKQDPVKEDTQKYKKEYKEYLQYVRSTGGRAFPSYEEFLNVYNSYKNDGVHPGNGNKKPQAEGSITDQSILSDENIIDYINQNSDITFFQVTYKNVYKNEGYIEVGLIGSNKEGSINSYEYTIQVINNKFVSCELV